MHKTESGHFATEETMSTEEDREDDLEEAIAQEDPDYIPSSVHRMVWRLSGKAWFDNNDSGPVLNIKDILQHIFHPSSRP